MNKLWYLSKINFFLENNEFIVYTLMKTNLVLKHGPKTIN